MFNIKNKKKEDGFSLVEILVALIAVSCISAALAPVITKKLKSNAITVGSMGGKMEFVVDCSAWGDDCVFCTEEKCSLCAKDCANNEFVYTQDCICKNCSEVDTHCIQCTAKKCKKCQTGYGLVNYRCEQCSAGTYSDGTTECLKAPVGYYVASSGASAPTACGAGTYQNEEGKTSCKTCSAGSYQDETGKSSCKTCEIDYMCTGGNNRTQCAANYGANAGSSSCSPCSSYCADCQVPNVCLRCNAGFYLNNNTCYPCVTGYSCDGTATQTSCPAGYYSGAGATSCTACSAGTYSSGSSSSCLSCTAGSYSGAGASSCTACSTGYYSGAGASSCTACSITWAHCTACTASGCSTCESGYELNSSGGCKEGAGPPRNQADCDPYGALFISAAHNGGTAICATKYNVGDPGGPPIVTGTTVVTTRNTCNNGNCCWQGKTAYPDWCGVSGNYNSTYSGCNRTVCQFTAALNSCDAWSPSEKATNWRLPKSAEVSAWTQSQGAINNNQGINGLQLCDWDSDAYGMVRCSPNWDTCKGTGQWLDTEDRDVCGTSLVWTIDYNVTGYILNSWHGIGVATSIRNTTAASVRCVTDNIRY